LAGADRRPGRNQTYNVFSSPGMRLIVGTAGMLSSALVIPRSTSLLKLGAVSEKNKRAAGLLVAIVSKTPALITHLATELNNLPVMKCSLQ
jgi:hypothetical protein